MERQHRLAGPDLPEGVLNYNNISITGATEKNRFYMGLGYINEEGIIKHENYQKIHAQHQR